MWTKSTIAQICHLAFILVLIGISGNYVDTHILSEQEKSAASKYRLHQAQLAFAILMLFSILAFLGLYIYLIFIVKNFHLLMPANVSMAGYNNNPAGFQQPVLSTVPMPMPVQQFPPGVSPPQYHSSSNPPDASNIEY